MNKIDVRIGRWNNLTISKIVDFGVYLDGGDCEDDGWGDILLPSRYVPEAAKIGDSVDVFVYFDSEDRITATTDKPQALVGEFAYLRVIDTNAAGAFLAWGLPKDLLVPYSEQAKKMRLGAFYMVYIFVDVESQRITASTKISRFLSTSPPDYQIGQQLSGMVMAKTDLGYKVIIEHRHVGMLYHNEIFTALKIGQSLPVIVQKIRPDNKIDLKLIAPDKHDLSALEDDILKRLAANNGVLHMGDKTPPETIYQVFGVSKKHFKRAVSRLYKQRLISVQPHCLKRVL